MNGLRLIALYSDRATAERTADLLRQEGFTGKAIELRDAGTDHHGAEAEIHAEAGRSTFGRGILTNMGIGKGVLLGTGAGVAIGATIGILGIVTSTPPPSDVALLGSSILGGGVAGSVAGTFIGGFSALESKRRAREMRMHGDTALVLAPDSERDLTRAEEIVRATGPNYVERTMPPRRQAG